jgi:predicted lipoprotein with Yx(FWY)xxD motif
MDPATIAMALKFIGGAIASAAAQQGVAAAMPKTSVTPVGAMPDAGGMDLNALVQKPQQQQSQLPSLQLQNRLPRPY